MEQLLLIIPVLACPIGMGVCMWMMAKHMRGKEKPAAEEQTDSLREREVEPAPPDHRLSKI